MAIVLAGCGGGPTDVPPPSAPALESVAAATRPGNVLSALVTARAQLADSVVVRFGMAGTSLGAAPGSISLRPPLNTELTTAGAQMRGR